MSGWITRSRWVAVGTGALSLCVGCVPASAGYDEVQSATQARLGKQVRWYQHEDRKDEDTERLLAKPLTADSAVQVALLNNAALQAGFEKLGIARAERVHALRLPNPTVGAALRYGASDRPAIDLEATMSLSQLLFMASRNGAAKAGFDATTLEVASNAIELAFDTQRAFYAYQAAKQKLGLRLLVLQSLKASVEMSERLREAGNTTELALITQQALYEETRIGYARDEALLATEREGLNRLLGLWGTSAAHWSATEGLPEVSPVDALLNGVEQRAVEQSLNLAIAKKRFEAAARRANVALLEGWVPDLRAGITAERDDTDWGVGPMAEIELPIFYQGQGENAVAEAEMRRERQAITDTAVRVRASARSLATRLAATTESARYYRDTVLPLRAQVVEQTQLQYNAMNAGVFQLLQAQRDQVAAQQFYVDLLQDYWTLRTELEQLLAGTLPSGTGSPPASSAPASQGAAAH